jgi:hypothetical protein
MATHYITHGATGNYIEATCTAADGTTPDFSSGTFQIEVFRKGKPTSVVLDSAPTAVSPAATSGKLRYTFVSGDWDTIPNRDEEYHVIWWHTSGGVVTPYPGGRDYDSLEVTADPTGTPSDVSSVSYVSAAVAAATYETIATGATHVTLSTAQTLTGQKTIEINGTGDFLKFDASPVGAGHMAVFYRNDPPATTGWDVASVINHDGAWYSNAYMVISGTLNAAADSEGIYMPRHPTTNPFMLGVWADVYGPAIVTRALGSGSGGYNYAAMSDAGNYVVAIDDVGKLWFGSSATLASLDCSIYRSGATALRTNCALTVDNRLDANGGVQTFALFDGNLNRRIDWTASSGATTYKTFLADGATAVGHIVDTNAAYSTAGAKIVSVRTNGVEKNSFDKDGKLGSVALQSPPDITGSRGGNAALADLLTELATLGLITDSTSA